MAGLAWHRLRPHTLWAAWASKARVTCQKEAVRSASTPLAYATASAEALQLRRREAPLRQRTSTGSCFTLGAPSDADLDFKGVIHIPPRNRRILHFPGITARYFWIYETLVVGGEPRETY